MVLPFRPGLRRTSSSSRRCRSNLLCTAPPAANSTSGNGQTRGWQARSRLSESRLSWRPQPTGLCAAADLHDRGGLLSLTRFPSFPARRRRLCVAIRRCCRMNAQRQNYRPRLGLRGGAFFKLALVRPSRRGFFSLIGDRFPGSDARVTPLFRRSIKLCRNFSVVSESQARGRRHGIATCART